jgi:hypothetical protein
MTPSLADLRYEGDALRLRLEGLRVADDSIRVLVGDVRTWQILCLSVIAGSQPARLGDFETEVGPVQVPLGNRSPSAGWLAQLDHSLVEWLVVIDWLRLLGDGSARAMVAADRPA